MTEDKPFEPTASRLARARREGDVARSSDANAVAALATGICALAGLLGPIASAAATAVTSGAAGSVAIGAYLQVAACALGVCVAALAGALASSFAQVPMLRFAFPAPKVEKLNPVAGLRRMFSRDALFGGAKALVAALAFGAVFVHGARESLGAAALASDPRALAARTLATLAGACIVALAVGGIFAAGDIALERRRRRLRLRMTFAELKRELRQTEGDPHLRGRRRHVQRALARGSVARLKDAAFVIANPEHVAIALEYRPPAVPVPRVLIRAIDAAAREVKRRARDLRVPVIENVALARSLLGATHAGDYIPPAAYAAVAAIVAALVRDGVLPEIPR